MMGCTWTSGESWDLHLQLGCSRLLFLFGETSSRVARSLCGAPKQALGDALTSLRVPVPGGGWSFLPRQVLHPRGAAMLPTPGLGKRDNVICSSLAQKRLQNTSQQARREASWGKTYG